MIRTKEQLNEMRINTPELYDSLKKRTAEAITTAFKVGDMTVLNVDMDLLNIPDFQRDLNEHRALELAESYDSSCNHPISIAYVDEVFWVIDGYHGLVAAMLAYGCNPNVENPITSVGCRLFVGKTFEECCLMFIGLNDKKSLSTYAKFNAYLLSGAITTKGGYAAKLVHDIVTVKYGVPIQHKTQKGRLSAVRTPFLLAQRRPDADEVLDWIFKILVQSDFYQNERGMAVDIILALEDVYDTFKNYHLDVATEVCLDIFEKNTYKTLLNEFIGFYKGIDKRTAIKHYLKTCVGKQLQESNLETPYSVRKVIKASKTVNMKKSKKSSKK